MIPWRLLQKYSVEVVRIAGFQVSSVFNSFHVFHTMMINFCPVYKQQALEAYSHVKIKFFLSVQCSFDPTINLAMAYDYQLRVL